MTISPNKKIKLDTSDLETDIQQFFKCPICFKSLYDNIYSCSNGHPLCNECYNRIVPRKCPTCRSENMTRDFGLERLGSTINTCALFDCPNEKCELTFTKENLKMHLRSCLYNPWIYPRHSEEVFDDLDSYINFLEDYNKSSFIYHKYTNFSETYMNIDLNFSDMSHELIPINHAFHFVDEKVIIYLIGSIANNRFTYAVYYQIYPELFDEEKTISVNTNLFIKNDSNLVRPKQKMYTTSINILHNSINLIDINRNYNRYNTRDNWLLSIHNDLTKSVTIDYNIFRLFYNVHNKICLSLTFDWFTSNNQEIDDSNEGE